MSSSCVPPVALSFVFVAGCASQSAPESAGAASPETAAPAQTQPSRLEVEVRSLDDEKKGEDGGGLELADHAAPPPVHAPNAGKTKLRASKNEPKPQSLGPEGVPGQVQGATSEKVAASVDPSLVQRAVATHPELFDRCVQASDVSIEVDATIAPSGKVIDAKCTRSVPDDPKLRDCVVEGFRRLSVGALTNDVPARVRFALALKRSGH